MSQSSLLINQIEGLNVRPGSLAVWGLGQMGVALKTSRQKVIYIDPVLTDVVTRKLPETAGRMDRAFPPPLLPEEIGRADYVLCTHEHFDHTDPYTLGPLAIASPQARFIATAWAENLLDEAGIAPERRIIPQPDQPVELDGLKVYIVPAGHYQVENDPQKGTRWMSLLLDFGDIRFFHTGDTILYPGYLEAIQKLPRAEIGMAAVNGRDTVREWSDAIGNLWPAEAAWLAGQAGWDVLLGGHNDLFAWNSIQPGDLLNAVHKVNPLQKVHFLKPGELYYYIRL